MPTSTWTHSLLTTAAVSVDLSRSKSNTIRPISSEILFRFPRPSQPESHASVYRPIDGELNVRLTDQVYRSGISFEENFASKFIVDNSCIYSSTERVSHCTLSQYRILDLRRAPTVKVLSSCFSHLSRFTGWAGTMLRDLSPCRVYTNSSRSLSTPEPLGKPLNPWPSD